MLFVNADIQITLEVRYQVQKKNQTFLWKISLLYLKMTSNSDFNEHYLIESSLNLISKFYKA